MRLLIRRFLLRPVFQTISVLILGLSIGFICWYFNTKLNIDKNTFTDYLTLFAQLSGLLLSFLIGFYFFYFQSNDAQKIQWYLEYRKSVDELIVCYKTLPTDLDYLSTHLAQILQNLDNVRIEDFPNDNLKDSYKDIKAIVEDTFKIDPIFNREILSILGKTEEYSNKINLTIIGVWISFALINSIYKQLYLLMTAILIIFLFNTFQLDNEKYIMFSISIIVGTLTILGFAELVTHIQYEYKNKVGE